MLISKGSPEGIFPLLSAYESEASILPLDAAALAKCRATYEDLSSAWLSRAGRRATPTFLRRNAYSVADERGLTLAGFFTFADPPG